MSNEGTAAQIIGDTGVLIQGRGVVHNHGTLNGTGTLAGSYGLVVGGPALVVDGDSDDTSALIEGYAAVRIGGGTVINLGTIESRGQEAGVSMVGAGEIINGYHGGYYGLDTVALIQGALGVEVAGAAGKLTNFGTVQATASGYGVEFLAGGQVTNSGAPALITGGVGVKIDGGAGTLVNSGTVRATGDGYGVEFMAGGQVTNGDGGLLVGGSGVGLFAPGTVVNSGAIEAVGAYGRGVYMTGGYLKNGSASDTSAVILGGAFGALLLDGPTSVVNYGAILSTRSDFGAGVHIENGTLVNGSAADSTAFIYRFTGVLGGYVNDTVINFGTIGGSGGTALDFSSATDTLIVEAGCGFIGAVNGGGGTLVMGDGTEGLLGGGAGTLRFLPGETEMVSGVIAKTTFSDFATVRIGAAATFASAGKVTIAAGQSVIDLGILTLGSKKKRVANAGTLEVDGGTLTVDGAVTGKGVARVNGGLLDFAAAFSQDVTFTGATGTLELARSTAYSGTISGFSRRGKTFLDLRDIAFGKQTTVSYSGTSSTGVLTVSDGTRTAHINLEGDYLSSSFVLSTDRAGGTLIHDPAPGFAPPAPSIGGEAGQRFIAAVAGFAACGAGAPGYTVSEPWRAVPAKLCAPRHDLA